MATERQAPPQEWKIGGQLFCLVPKGEYERLASEAGKHSRNTPVGAQHPIGEELRRRRREIGLTQSEVARRAGIRSETLSRLENGRGNPTVATLQAILLALTGNRREDLDRLLQEDLERRVESRTRELRRKSDELQRIIDALPVLVSFVGKDERYVRVNSIYERWFGRKREEVEGRHLREVLGEEAYDSIREHVRAALAGEPVSFEAVIPYRDGGPRHVRAIYVPYRDPTGNGAGFVALVEDVTAEKRALEASALLAEIVRSTHDAVATKTLDGTITSWNAGAERIFGYTAAEIVGRPVSVLIPERRLEEERVILERIGRGDRVDHYETVRRRKDGSEIEVSLTVSPVRDHAGRIVGASKIARDITDRVRAEAEIRRLNADLERRVRERTLALEETVKELDTFAYTVAHDLRAPLRAVHGLGQIILEEYVPRLDGKGREYLTEMIAAAGRMNTLITDLLAYSRLSRVEIPIQPVSLDAVVERVLSEMSADLAERRADVRIERPLPRVRAHPATLAQAISNLVSNAAKFVAPGVVPRISIRAESLAEEPFPGGEGRVRLWVEDNGIGIDGVHQPRLFRVFERLHGRDDYPGTGIGLAIVRRAVERMQGRVGLESEPGRGCRFFVELRKASD